MSKQSPWEYENDEIILFWGGILSNWYRSDLEVAGVIYNCVEQFMMAEKAREFNDSTSEQLIMINPSPREQKMLGRKVRNFDQERWEEVCLERVLPGIQAKFEQNEALGGLLLTTGNKVIAEASPYDKIWGIGLAPDNPLALDQNNWDGTNFLGELIMIVRDSLRATRDFPTT